MPRERHVVIGKEHHAAVRARAARECDDPLDQLLAALVGGMGLAREHDLERTLGIREQARQPLGVAEEQIGALVGREAPREADRQGVWIERRTQPSQAHEAEKLVLCRAVRTPQRVVVELVGAREVGRAGVLLAAEQRLERLGDPGACVHAVRDRADRRLLDRAVGPEAVPHLARDLAV